MGDEVSVEKPSGDPSQEEPPPKEAPLRSRFTPTFATLLEKGQISVAVTTYQAGYTILLRHDGETVNTHFWRAKRAMGLAANCGHLAIGTDREIVQLENMVEAGARIKDEEPCEYDACYLPRNVHVTGNIDIHDLAFARPEGSDPSADSHAPVDHNELWFVNTRFSCLCTLDGRNNFVPRWRPPFVSGLSPQDRCHLNGLGLVDGRPRYVTALGSTDTPTGWREKKATGGVLIDIEADEIVAAELSMPHSPRWVDGRLWMLESGDGSIGTVDLKTGKYEPVVRVDGFTRGLDIIGPYALVGISKIRQSNVFGGIPIAERLSTEDRKCGVSVINLEMGKEVGFLYFEGDVEEIFAVQILPHRFPAMLALDDDLLGGSYALPTESLPDVEWLDVPVPEA